ncbi:transketolase C-terminal domain-containing protein [Clostridia bacterium UC5.1-1D1]|uniref:transketolase family protein n=1 Tax=Agathobaculum massiliense TaxID=3014267 RepID=UPI0006C7CA75
MKYKGTREAASVALQELAGQDERVVFVSSDSLKAMRAVAFAEQYPDRYIECGIAEQGSVDVAAGLAACGAMPFVATYAGFLTMRACEQMRTFVAYPQLNVKFIGINAGLIGGEREGVTHQFYEDLAILSAIPHFTIFTPADAQQTYEAVKAASQIDGPVYIRAGSGREPDIYPEGTPFSMDGFTVLRSSGNDILLLANGFILNRVLDAGTMLAKQGIGVTVADVNILYQREPEKLLALLQKFNTIVTVEDHNVNGGLGSYICGLTAEYHPAHVYRFGLNNTFGESGAAKELADYYGFSAEGLAEYAKSKL